MSDGSTGTAVELWDATERRAGLQIARRRGGPDYDTALLETLRTELALPDGSIRACLKRGGCSLETLLTGFLLALQPWSRMMSDVLSMLAEAGAAGGSSIGLQA